MDIPMAHLNIQGIDVAVFDADTRVPTQQARATLLSQLTRRARASGLRVSKSALAYRSCGRLEFYGTPDLVRYLAAAGGIPRWTHTLTV